MEIKQPLVQLEGFSVGRRVGRVYLEGFKSRKDDLNYPRQKSNRSSTCCILTFYRTGWHRVNVIYLFLLFDRRGIMRKLNEYRFWAMNSFNLQSAGKDCHLKKGARTPQRHN